MESHNPLVHANGNGNTSNGYYERLEGFRKSDAERDALVQDVLQRLQELEYRYQEKCSDYDNEVESRRIWQSKAAEAQRYVQSIQRSSDTNPFVMALIDGDGALFQDGFIQAGAEGGADAAYQLHQEIRKHVADIHPNENTTRWNIVVQIFYNMEGLATKLRHVGILGHPAGLAHFARAFGLNQPLFSFIDVGTGKERADAKLRETFRLFLPNMQCKHIIFGPSHDNGYLTVLDPFKRDPTTAGRISLLETLPAQPDFKALGFPMVRFPSLFRSQNLPANRVPTPPEQSFPLPLRTQSSHSIGPAVPTASMMPPAGLTNITNTFNASPVAKPSSPAPSNTTEDSSWAAVGKKAAAGAKEINLASQKTPQPRYILVNSYDQRVDEALPRADKSAVIRLFERIKHGKICNDYHINGKCDAGEYCDYDHGERLSKSEQLALKHQARKRSCNSFSECRSFDCVSGHVCSGDKYCYGSTCYFAPVHDVDPTPAWRLFEDGRKELVRRA